MEAVKCPVCGKRELTYEGDVCEVCTWLHDELQEENPDEEDCINHMSLNQAREAYKKGLPLE